MSAEATSKTGITSILARGTGGYRAPELIRDIHQFTNKVDIWALGCILQELTNKSKAFKDDWDIRACIESKELILSNPSVPEVLQDHFAKIRDSLLSLNYETRPRASELRLLSEAFCHILSPSVTQNTADLLSFPTYTQWKHMVDGHMGKSDFLTRLGGFYESRQESASAIRVWTALTETVTDNAAPDGLATQTPDWSESLELWKQLIVNYPSRRELRDMLAIICQEIEKPDWVITIWKELASEHPSHEIFRDQLVKACTEHDDSPLASQIWRDMVHDDPHSVLKSSTLIELCEDNEFVSTLVKEAGDPNQSDVRILLQGLKDVCKTTGATEGATAALQEFWSNRPDWLWATFAPAVFSKVECNLTVIFALKKLVTVYPNNRALRDNLDQACNLVQEGDLRVAVWKDILEQHPNVAGLEEGLQHAEVAYFIEFVSTLGNVRSS